MANNETIVTVMDTAIDAMLDFADSRSRTFMNQSSSRITLHEWGVYLSQLKESVEIIKDAVTAKNMLAEKM